MNQVASAREHVFCPLDKLVAGAYAYISMTGTSRTAVVFVHGFSGNPTDTWAEFHSLIDFESERFPEWRRSDAFFFTYSDFSNSIDTSLDDLLDFTGIIFPTPSQDLRELLPDLIQLPSRYESLILVGHSEGAVVIRASIAELASRWEKGAPRSPILDSRISLFAPAHMGFVPTGWLGALAVISGIKTIFDLAIVFSPAATEMRDKTALFQTKEITEKLCEKYPDVPALTAHVLFGTEESVVVRSRYYQDCRHRPEKSKDHTTICKPNSDYLRPLRFVAGDCPK